MRKQLNLILMVGALALLAAPAARAQPGAFFQAVTNLHPLGYWTLNETNAPPGSKPSAANSGTLGAADNGTYTDGAFPGTKGALAGDVDTAGLFSGASGLNPMVQAPYSASYATVTVFTVEFWVNSPLDPGWLYAATYAPQWPCPVNCVDTGSTMAGWLIYEGANGTAGTFNFQTFTNGPNASLDMRMNVPPALLDSQGHMLSNTWYYVAVSFDGTHAIGYINGQQVTNRTASGYVASTAGGFTIGNRNDMGYSFPGFMDEVAFYSNVLSAADILAHYQAATNPAPATAYHTLVANDHPMLYYRLDDASSPVATNSGTLGAFLNGYYETGVTPGVPGPAYAGLGANSFACSFDGSSAASVNILNAIGLVNLGDMDGLINAPAQSVTLAAWVQVPAGPVGTFQTVAGTGDSMYRLSVDTSGLPHFAEGNADAVGSAAMNDGMWHFWVGVWDQASKNEYIYIDGQLAGTASPTGGGTAGQPFLIGNAPDYNNRTFIGSVAHVALFDSALSSSQVANLFSAAAVPPRVTLNPADSFYNAGAMATLTAAATGSAPLTYRWYTGTPGSGTPLSNGNRVSGADTPTLVINPVIGSDQNSYFLMVTNAAGQTNSSVVKLTMSTAVSARIFAGRSPTFQVTPGAVAPFTYQWKTNGVVDTSATGHTYTLHNVSVANNAETVQCAITDASFTGTANSSVYTLSILAQPSDPYAVAVLADNPIAYFRLDEQNISGDNGAGNDGSHAWDNISGQNGIYSNVVLEATGFQTPARPADSDGSAVFGTNSLSPPSFAAFIPGIDFALAVSNSPAQPGNAAFSVEAWVQGSAGQHNGGLVTKGYGKGQDSSPAHEQFSLQNSDVGSSGSRFEFDVLDAQGNLASALTGAGTINGAWHHVVGVCDQAHGRLNLYVDGKLNVTGTITPGNGVMGSTVPVSIGAKQVTDTSGNYSGQWSGTVDEVAIYNTALSSNQVQNHYFAAGVVPIMTLQPLAALPGNQTNAPEGSTVSISSAAFGSPVLSYQWYDYNAGTPIPWQPGVATSPTLVLQNVNSSDIGSGSFVVVVTNAYGAVTSTVAIVSIVSGPPIINPDVAPTNYTVVGGVATVSVGLTGTAPFTNRWLFNGVPLNNGGRISGAQSTTLTIANVATTDAGTYQFWATNSHGTTPSSVSTLVVDNEPRFNGTANPNGYGWTATGTASFTPSMNNGVLTITTDSTAINSAFFFNNPMYIGAFEAKFTYQRGALLTATADGITFCLQNDPRGVSAVGGTGNNGGYSGNPGTGISPSAAIQLELFPQIGSVGWNFLTDGATATFFISTSPVDNSTGGAVDWSIYYNGSSIMLTMMDETNHAFYGTNFVVGSLPSAVGGNTALIGFTGATGGYAMEQFISNFSFTPIPVLSVVRSGGSVVLTWPTGIGGYVLQKNSSVGNPAGWTTIAGPYPIVGANYQLSVAPPPGVEFYRLVVSP
jgi:hypothetical protein